MDNNQEENEVKKAKVNEKYLMGSLGEAIQNGDFGAFWEMLKNFFSGKSEQDNNKTLEEITKQIIAEEKINTNRKKELISIANNYAEDAKNNIEVDKIEEGIEKIKADNGIDLNDPNTMKQHKQVTEEYYKRLYENKRENSEIGDQREEILNLVREKGRNSSEENSLQKQYLTAFEEQKKLEAGIKEFETRNDKANKVFEELKKLNEKKEKLSVKEKNVSDEIEANNKTIEELKGKLKQAKKDNIGDNRNEEKIKSDFFGILGEGEGKVNIQIDGKTVTGENYNNLSVEKKKEFAEKYKRSVENNHDIGAQVNIALLEKLAIEAELEEVKNKKQGLQQELQKSLDQKKKDLTETQQQIEAQIEELFKVDPGYKELAEKRDAIQRVETSPKNISNLLIFPDNNENEKTLTDIERIEIVRDDIKQELLNASDDKLKEMFGIEGEDTENKLKELKESLFNDENGSTTVSLDDLTLEELENLMKYQQEQAKKDGIDSNAIIQAQRNAAYLEQVAIPNKKKEEEELNKQIEEQKEKIYQRDPEYKALLEKKRELLNASDDKLKEMFGIEGEDTENKLKELKESLFNDENGSTTVSLDDLTLEELENLMKYQQEQAKKDGIDSNAIIQAQRNAAYLEQVAIPNKKKEEELNKQIEKRRNEISQNPELIAKCVAGYEYEEKNKELEAKKKEVEEKGNKIVNEVNAHMDIGMKREQQVEKLEAQARPVPNAEDYIRKMAEIDAIKNGASLEKAREAAKRIQVGQRRRGGFILNSAQDTAVEYAKQTIQNQQTKIQKCKNDMKIIEDNFSVSGGGLEKTKDKIESFISEDGVHFQQTRKDAQELFSYFLPSLIMEKGEPDGVLAAIEDFKRQPRYKDSPRGTKNLFDKAIKKYLTSNIELYKISKVVIEKCEKISEKQYETIRPIVNKKVEKIKKNNQEKELEELEKNRTTFEGNSFREIKENLIKKLDEYEQKKEELTASKERYKNTKKKLKQNIGKIENKTESIKKSIKRKNYVVNDGGKVEEVTWQQKIKNSMNNTVNKVISKKSNNKGQGSSLSR